MNLVFFSYQELHLVLDLDKPEILRAVELSDLSLKPFVSPLLTDRTFLLCAYNVIKLTIDRRLQELLNV